MPCRVGENLSAKLHKGRKKESPCDCPIETSSTGFGVVLRQSGRVFVKSLCCQFLVYQMVWICSRVAYSCHSIVAKHTTKAPRIPFGPAEQRSNKNATNFFFLLSFLVSCSVFRQRNNKARLDLTHEREISTSCNEVSIAIIAVLLLPLWLIDFVSHSRQAARSVPPVTYRSAFNRFYRRLTNATANWDVFMDSQIRGLLRNAENILSLPRIKAI